MMISPDGPSEMRSTAPSCLTQFSIVARGKGRARRKAKTSKPPIIKRISGFLNELEEAAGEDIAMSWVGNNNEGVGKVCLIKAFDNINYCKIVEKKNILLFYIVFCCLMLLRNSKYLTVSVKISHHKISSCHDCSRGTTIRNNNFAWFQHGKSPFLYPVKTTSLGQISFITVLMQSFRIEFSCPLTSLGRITNLCNFHNGFY